MTEVEKLTQLLSGWVEILEKDHRYADTPQFRELVMAVGKLEKAAPVPVETDGDTYALTEEDFENL